MSEIIHIHNHIAFACECGSVHFHLLKSGSIECAGCQFMQAHTWETPTAWEAKHHEEMSYVNDIAELQLERDRLTAANEALKGENAKQHEELRRIAEFANCMGNPVEYEDDTVYLKHLKASAHVYADLNAKYREALERIATHEPADVYSYGEYYGECIICDDISQIAREALALGEGA